MGTTHLFCEGVVTVERVLLVVGLTVVVDDEALFDDNDVAIFDVGEEMMTLRGSFFNFSASISSFLQNKCKSLLYHCRYSRHSVTGPSVTGNFSVTRLLVVH